MSIRELLHRVQDHTNAFAKAKELYHERLAPDFNPFDFIEPNEIRLSRILAWLLNPRTSHGQGGRFLDAFLARLGIPWERGSYDNMIVTPEGPANGRRIDILVTSGDASPGHREQALGRGSEGSAFRLS